MKLVEVGQFCRVQDSTYAEHGVKKGDIVYLAGDTYVMVSEDDPYAYRKVFLAAWMDGDHIDIEKGCFTIDGKRLKGVTKPKQAKLDSIKAEDFDKGEGEDDTKD